MKHKYNLLKAKSLILVSLLLVLSLFASCSGKEKIVSKRNGNTEVVTSKKGGKVLYKLVYTYENNRIVRGEHWLPSDDKESKKKGNILSGTAVAKSFAKLLQGKNYPKDDNIELGKREGKFQLNFVQLVRYDNKGRPKNVKRRGYSDIPILGRFEMKTDLDYSYDNKGNLRKITETNMNVDSLLLNMAIGNVTTITRDGKGRPVKVAKLIGSVPPAGELTTYSYYGGSPNLEKTVYDKVGLNGLRPVKTETITTWYAKNKVPWKGFAKYNFDIPKKITGFKVYDHTKGRDKLDGSKFMKMNYMQKTMFLKDIYDMTEYEAQGPSWRMGDLPDRPIPFMHCQAKAYKKYCDDYAWFN